MVYPSVHEVASALHEQRTVRDLEAADSCCARCTDVYRCRAAGACVSRFGGTLSLVPGSPEHVAKVAARAQIDAVREGDAPCRECGGETDYCPCDGKDS